MFLAAYPMILLPNVDFEYGYTHYNACLRLLTKKPLIHLKFEHFNPHKAACHPKECDIIVHDVKLFPKVCRRYTVANF